MDGGKRENLRNIFIDRYLYISIYIYIQIQISKKREEKKVSARLKEIEGTWQRDKERERERKRKKEIESERKSGKETEYKKTLKEYERQTVRESKQKIDQNHIFCTSVQKHSMRQKQTNPNFVRTEQD